MSDNFRRADKALQALRLAGYDDPAQAIDELLPRPDGTMTTLPEHDAYSASDLVGDLMHLAARLQVDPFCKLREAVEHYGADLIEQAFQHDPDTFTATLENPANRDAALRVLAVNQGPELCRQGILDKLAL